MDKSKNFRFNLIISRDFLVHLRKVKDIIGVATVSELIRLCIFEFLKERGLQFKGGEE